MKVVLFLFILIRVEKTTKQIFFAFLKLKMFLTKKYKFNSKTSRIKKNIQAKFK